MAAVVGGLSKSSPVFVGFACLLLSLLRNLNLRSFSPAFQKGQRSVSTEAAGERVVLAGGGRGDPGSDRSGRLQSKPWKPRGAALLQFEALGEAPCAHCRGWPALTGEGHVTHSASGACLSPDAAGGAVQHTAYPRWSRARWLVARVPLRLPG